MALVSLKAENDCSCMCPRYPFTPARLLVLGYEKFSDIYAVFLVEELRKSTVKGGIASNFDDIPAHFFII